MRGWGRVGAAVVERRRVRGFRTQADFATALGVSRRTVAALERGEHPMSDDTVAAVERVLRWEPGSIDRILAGGAPSDDNAGELRHIAAVWPNLDERERAIVLAVIDVLRTLRP